MQKNTLEGKAKTKNGIKRLCFCAVCILLEVIFMVSMITRICRDCKSSDTFAWNNPCIGIICVRSDFIHEDAVDYSDTDIPDHGCCVISADWFKWWHTEDAQTV